MTGRIERMRKAATETPIVIGLEKLRIAMDTLEECRNLPTITYRSTLHANYYNRMPISIPDDDLICGTGSSHHNGVELDYEMGVWSKAELDHLKEETGDMYYISPEDEAELEIIKDKLNVLAKNYRMSDYLAEFTWDNPRMNDFIRSGVTMPIWKDRNSGATNGIGQTGIGLGPGFVLKCVEYERILNEGARVIIDEAKECLENERCITDEDFNKHNYWEGVVRVFEGFINYAHRHADLAEKMAGECKDETRKKELLKMAETCRRVPEFPARTFYEAIQAFWFTFLSMASNTMSAGRIDQYLYPFYKADKEAGRITDDEVLELLELLKVKTTTFHTARGGLGRGRHSGDSRWLNFILGGCDPKTGADASNELTMLFIKASTEMVTPHHTITLRVGKYTPAEVVKAGVDCVATGCGMPAFVADESYIKFFTDKGYALEDARNYAICGCLDAVIPGKARTMGVIFYNQCQVLDAFLHEGYMSTLGKKYGPEPKSVYDCKTFEEFCDAYYEYQNWFTGMVNERSAIDSVMKMNVIPDVFPSALMHDGVKCGIPYEKRHFKPFDTGSTVMTVGGVNAINSLVAIKKLVYDDKKYTMKEFIKALDDNWAGHEDILKDAQDAPKYGNNDDYADDIAADFYHHFAEQVESYPSSWGSTSIPSGISISAHQPCGKCVAATADGRLANTILADGMISPAQGTDTNGPLAVFNSGRKIAQDEFSATLLNMKFNPDILKTDEDKAKLASAIKAYLTNGGKQVQMSVVSKETLMAAQAKPKDYRDIIVRVAGYSAYFVTLTDMMQNEIIARTENDHID